MRVLHVTPYFAPAFCYGGPPRSVLGLCRALQRAGVGVEVFTTTSNGDSELPPSPSDGEQYEGLRVHYFARGFPRPLFGAPRLGEAIRTRIRRYDVVHIHGLWNLPAWQAARHARRAGVPYVLSPRGMVDAGSLAHHSRRKKVAYWLVERRNLASAALLHATSASEARALERCHTGVSVMTVPNGVEVPDGGLPGRGEFRRQLGVSTEAPLIVFLGRIHPVKRMDLLAAAFQRVRGICREARLVLAGPEEMNCRRDVESRVPCSSASVHWTGELGEAEKWRLLADATVLVMCSDSESFGLAVVEAMAAGVPVVVTRTCPWPDIEIAGCGFWVRQDPEAIAGAVLQVLDHPTLAQTMGARGRALAAAKYSWDTIAGAMAEHYRLAASRRLVSGDA